MPKNEREGDLPIPGWYKYPDCYSGGPHRPRQMHFSRWNKRLAWQVCRVCGKHFYYEFREVNGRTIEVDVTSELTHVNIH